MLSNTKFIRTGLLAAVIITGSIIVTSCGSSVSTGGNAPPASQTPAQATGQAAPQNGSNPSGFRSDSMAKAAAALGISQDKLEAAFTEARSELGMSTNLPSFGGSGTPGTFRDRGTPTPRADRSTPPADLGGRSSGTPRAGMSSELMAKVATILGISQQDLENAFSQAQ